MKLLLRVIEDLSSLFIEWYGDYVKKIIVGGKSFEKNDETEETIFLITLDKVSKISLYARGEIFSFFYNKVRNKETTKDFILNYGILPKIYGLLLSPKELEYEIPLLEYLNTHGRVIYSVEEEKNG
ncbi:hypothetical protein SULI_01065 [Saccharolobus solfataricus]|uniref:Uncharacterized protein n=3 Tax=Saccharolobus solfataricus TaxID=2287 RepID=Q97W32_SACS2|nr:hypothetical protein [Saccharolobus solfataricus]AAK42558.1 Hypothetical protein SSO2410 [Saccharolobus solfataricus P2]AKA72650.1 hypothetical protein SULB_0211 [Saccharolobus solfataricus]AKA75350.1 hypothetical protein SULC_0210 [Saccharolobus solfataricus]AKA78042.1 hypothetical protein SULA_0210 [Saccharolobus solfataricus]AZF67163.1 hypothetical protein SULG_01065 [Saccharolobus solfataricus]